MTYTKNLRKAAKSESYGITRILVAVASLLFVIALALSDQANAQALSVSGIDTSNEPASVANNTDFGTFSTPETKTNTFILVNGENSSGDHGDITITSITVSGTNANNFEITQSPSLPLTFNRFTNPAPRFAVEFDPSSSGNRVAQVTITSSTPGISDFVINLQGSGAPEMDVHGTSVSGDTPTDSDPEIARGALASTSTGTDFGFIASGQSETRTFRIYNQGNVSLRLVGSPAIQIDDATNFTVTQPSDTAFTSNRTFQIAFNPQSQGNFTANVTIANDDPDENPYTFQVSGTSTPTAQAAPTVAPDLRAFADTGILDDDNVTNSTSLEFDAQCPVGTGTRTIQFFVDGSAQADTLTCTSDGETVRSADYNLAEGDRVITYRATNSTGTESTDSPSLTVTVDRTAPTPQSLVGTRAPGHDPFVVRAIYSEPVTDFTTGFVPSSDADRTNVTAIGGTQINGQAVSDTFDVTIDPFSSRATQDVVVELLAGVTDVAGNFGSTLGASVETTFAPQSTVDATPPIVQSITLVGSPAASATSVTYRVTFDESTNNLSADDFEVTTVSGNATGAVVETRQPGTANIAQSTINNAVDVLLNNISGTGSIRLDLKANNNLVDDSGNGNNNNGNGRVAAFTGGDLHNVNVPAAAAPEIKVSFGSAEAQAGETVSRGNIASNAGIITIENVGTSDLVLGPIEVVPGPNVADATVSQPSLTTLQPGQTTTASFSIVPKGVTVLEEQTPRSVTLRINSSDADEGQFDRTFTYTAVNADPDADGGGDLTVASGTANVQLDGSGSSDVNPDQTLTYQWSQFTGTSVSITNPTSPIASFDAPVLAPGSNDETITFVLDVTDGIESERDTVEVTVTAPAAAPDIEVTSRGLDGTAAPVELTSGDVASTTNGTDFGNVPLGDVAEIQIMYRNAGTSDLTITSLEITGPHANEFSANFRNTPETLIPNLGTGFGIDFTPTQTGTRTASVVIRSDDPDEDPFVINFTANAVQTQLTANAGTPQSKEVGQQFDTRLQVRVTDANGQPIEGATVVFTAPESGASGEFRFQNITTSSGGFLTNAQGVAEAVDFFANTTAGTYNVVATLEIDDQTIEDVAPVNFVLTNTPGNAAGLSIVSGDDQTSPLNQAFDDPFVVQIVDANGNLVSGETVDFAVAAGNGGASATLSENSSVTNADGQAQITATANGTAGTYSITASSGTLTPVSFTVTNREGPTVEETQTAIADFMLNRANLILSNQPDLIGRFKGNTSSGGRLGTLQIEANEASQTFSFSTSRSKILSGMRKNEAALANMTKSLDQQAKLQARLLPQALPLNPVDNASQDTSMMDVLSAAGDAGDKDVRANSAVPAAEIDPSRFGTWDVWLEVHGSRSKSEISETSLGLAYLGAHYFFDDHTLVGLLGQIDWADETNFSTNAHVDGVGWMVGPYIAGQVPAQKLFYEARVAYGHSDNTISPDNTFSDGFDTERFLASAKASGSFSYGDYTVSPEARVSYFEETQNAYTDSIGNLIPEQTISLGEFRFGPEVSRTFLIGQDMQIETTLGASGVFNFAIRDENASQGFALGDEDFRARFDVGFKLTNSAGLSVAASGFYDGVGSDDFESYGGTLKLVVPLN